MSDDGLLMYLLPFLSMISFIFITSSMTIQYNTIESKYKSILMSDDAWFTYVSVTFFMISFIFITSATIKYNTIGSKYESSLMIFIFITSPVTIQYIGSKYEPIMMVYICICYIFFYDFIYFLNFICDYSMQHNSM